MDKRKTNGERDNQWYCDYCEEYHSINNKKYEEEGNQFCRKWIYLHREEE